MKTLPLALALTLITTVSWGQSLSFTVAPAIPAGVAPTSVLSGDFNGDGKPDIAITNRGGVAVLLNNGSGGLHPAVSHVAATSPQFVAVGDFNGDGYRDLAVANLGNGSAVPVSVSILLGNGDGSFRTGANCAAGVSPRSLAVRDLNGDGKPDLVLANIQTGTVSVLLGNGNGTFQPAVNYSLGSGAPQPQWWLTISIWMASSTSR